MKKFSPLLILSSVLLVPAATHANDVGQAEIEKLRASGTIKSFEALDAIAISRHGGAVIKEGELELEHGRYVYQVEMRDPQGAEYDVEIDAATGEILQDRVDD